MRRLGVLFGLFVLLLVLVPPAASASIDIDYAFRDTWDRTDMPVSEQKVNRTWMWGPAVTEAMTEPYQQSPNQARKVQYFDKSRMEVNDPNADPSSPWYVTNGLLAKELITGERQFGDNLFAQYPPAQVNVAGDPNDPNGPTYATFNTLMGNAPVPSGWGITQVVNRAGQVHNDQSTSQYGVTAKDVGAPTNHTVASVFWDFMNSSGLVYQDGGYTNDPLFPNPFYATGYPLTEAYWATVLVGGVPKLVLTQVFERRVLTYTPSNPDGWKVEAGNVGQHYYTWRYVDAPSIGTRGNPVPLGATAELENGWRVRVAGVTPDATSQVLAENMFNPAPPAGYQDFMVTLTVTYEGKGSASFDWFDLHAVGASNVAYPTSGYNCGVAPNDFLEIGELFTGGTATANTCWMVRSSDVSSLEMYYDTPAGGGRAFFALH